MLSTISSLYTGNSLDNGHHQLYRDSNKGERFECFEVSDYIIHNLHFFFYYVFCFLFFFWNLYTFIIPTSIMSKRKDARDQEGSDEWIVVSGSIATVTMKYSDPTGRRLAMVSDDDVMPSDWCPPMLCSGLDTPCRGFTIHRSMWTIWPMI